VQIIVEISLIKKHYHLFFFVIHCSILKMSLIPTFFEPQIETLMSQHSNIIGFQFFEKPERIVKIMVDDDDTKDFPDILPEPINAKVVISKVLKFT